MSEGERLRLLECWLPLAQALDAEQGWGLAPAELAALVGRAAPLLQAAEDVGAARAILALCQAQREREEGP